MRLLALAAFVLAGMLASPQTASAQRSSDFDFYVLSLSWSPTFCQTTGNVRGEEQCSLQRPRAFVLHGLWPQNERGYPEFCSGRQPPRIPDGIITRMLDVMPSRGLIIHEWRRHGTCSGLDPQTYFDTARRAFSQLVIPDGLKKASADGSAGPDDIRQAFINANPGLPADGLAVTCADGKLEEVRVCLSKTLTPRRCPEVARQACRARLISIPAAGSN